MGTTNLFIYKIRADKVETDVPNNYHVNQTQVSKITAMPAGKSQRRLGY